jgi:hypothetical protein
MNIDHKVRLVTICDINGKMMYSDYREGVENLPAESKKSLKLAVDAWKIRSGLAPCGSLNPIFILLLCIICRRKRRLIAYSFLSYKAISHTELIKKPFLEVDTSNKITTAIILYHNANSLFISSI